MGVGGRSQVSAALLPATRSISIVREAECNPGPVWTGAENLAVLPEFDSGTVQPVGSLCTDCAVLAHGDVPLISPHGLTVCIERALNLTSELCVPVSELLRLRAVLAAVSVAADVLSGARCLKRA
jgi:hypothetical protein